MTVPLQAWVQGVNWWCSHCILLQQLWLAIEIWQTAKVWSWRRSWSYIFDWGKTGDLAGKLKDFWCRQSTDTQVLSSERLWTKMPLMYWCAVWAPRIIKAPHTTMLGKTLARLFKKLAVLVLSPWHCDTRSCMIKQHWHVLLRMTSRHQSMPPSYGTRPNSAVSALLFNQQSLHMGLRNPFPNYVWIPREYVM